MSSPTATCQVTGSWPETGGNVASGDYIVTPAYEALGDGVLVPVTDVRVTLDDSGVGTMDLTYVPGQTQWKITERINGADNPDPYIVTPEGNRLDLSTAPRSAPPGSPVSTFVLASSVGAVGGPGGPLDAEGKMPAGQIPPTGGGIPASIITAKGDLIVGTAVDTPAVLPVSPNDGDLLAADSTAPGGVSYVPAPGPAVVAFSTAVFTEGSVTPANSAGLWLPLKRQDGVSLFSRTVPAQVGDLISVGLNTFFQAVDNTTHLDLAVLVNGVATRYLSNMATAPAVPSFEGDPGWYPNGAAFKWHPAPAEWQAAATDIASDGTVTVAVIYKGGTGTFFAEVNYPCRMTMKNLGLPSMVA